jgi:hypothetical protein
MSKGSGLSRSERRRNARKERLRALVPRGGAVIGIDLGEEKQALALVDHDVRVLWRKTARVRAHQLGEAPAVILAEAGDPRRYETSKFPGQARGPVPGRHLLRCVRGHLPYLTAGTARAADRGLARGHPAPAPQPRPGPRRPPRPAAPP